MKLKITLACLLLAARALNAAVEPPPAPDATAQPGVPTLAAAEAKLEKFGWSKEGNLVLAVRLIAGGKALNLGKVTKVKLDNGKTEDNDEGFSLISSTLLDVQAQKPLAPLAKLPRKPFYGSMGGMISLNPGDSILLGVAFPKPAAPPPGKDGKPAPYKLVLQIPDFKPIPLEIPYPEAPAVIK